MTPPKPRRSRGEGISDDCPLGGCHDWRAVDLDWENIPAWCCAKCDEVERR